MFDSFNGKVNVNNISQMIFVVGNSRSGTTMMSNILENHLDIYKIHELHFFEELWTPEENDELLTGSEALNLANRLLSAQRHDYVFKVTERYIEEAQKIIRTIDSNSLRAIYIYEAFLGYEVFKNNCKAACESTPRNVFYIGEILENFPHAKIINMVRDPRDVLLSQKRKWRRSYLRSGGRPLKETLRALINYHPITISKLWNAAISAADKFNDNDRVCTVRYEDLLKNPENAVSRVCGFVGIDYDQTLLDIPHTGSSHVKDSKNKGIRKASGPKWQGGGLNSTEIYLCQNITMPHLRKHGYEPAAIRANPVLLLYYFISFPVKLGFALLLNLGRMRNIADTIKRRLS